MDYTLLGGTDLKVSRICLGTMTWGEQNSENEGFEQMDYAVAQGINFFDTAELYSIPPKEETQGKTEQIIGNWLRSRKARDKIILATKVTGRSENQWLREDRSPTELSPTHIREALDKSLKRLQTDYIDLYQLHWPDRPMPWGSNPTVWRGIGEDTFHAFEEILETLTELIKEGKIRFIGVSNESAWGLMRFLETASRLGLARMHSIQNAYNLLNRTYETALAEISERENISLLAYSPLGQGYLTGKYLDGARPAGARTTLFNRGERYEKPGSDDAIRKYVELAKAYNLAPATLAIAFVNSRRFVKSTIIGATTMEQLKQAIAAHDILISSELEKEINKIHQIHCNPCP